MPYLFRHVVVHGPDGTDTAPQRTANFQRNKHARFLFCHFLGNMLRCAQIAAVAFHVMFNYFPGQLHIFILFGQPFRFHLVADGIISIQEMTAVIFPGRPEQGDAVAYAEGTFIAQHLAFYCQAVEGAGHQDEGTVSALGSFFQKCFLKREEVGEGSASHHFHNALIIFRAGGIEPVGPVFCQFVGQVAAGDPGNVASQLFRCFRNKHAHPVMLFQGKAGQGQPYDFAVTAVFGEKIEWYHGSVVQLRLPVAQRACRDAFFFCCRFHGFHQFFIIGAGKFQLRRAELGHVAFGGSPRRDMEIIGIQNGMGTGDDHRVRVQVRNELCGGIKCVNRCLDPFFFPMSHFRNDERRMGNLYCAKDCHGKNSFRFRL